MTDPAEAMVEATLLCKVLTKCIYINFFMIRLVWCKSDAGAQLNTRCKSREQAACRPWQSSMVGGETWTGKMASCRLAHANGRLGCFVCSACLRLSSTLLSQLSNAKSEQILSNSNYATCRPCSSQLMYLFFCLCSNALL